MNIGEKNINHYTIIQKITNNKKNGIYKLNKKNKTKYI